MIRYSIPTNKRSRRDVYLTGFITTVIIECFTIVCIYLMTLPRVNLYLDQFFIITSGMNR